MAHGEIETQRTRKTLSKLPGAHLWLSDGYRQKQLHALCEDGDDTGLERT